MKLLLDKPVTDRIAGKPVTFAAGTAVDFPEEEGQRLLDKGVGRDFPSTKEEKDVLDNATRHPSLSAPAVPGGKK